MEVTSEPRCYIRHVRAAMLCHKGSREWCEHNGIDWDQFLSEGIPARVLRETGDPIVARVAALAEAEANAQ